MVVRNLWILAFFLVIPHAHISAQDAPPAKPEASSEPADAEPITTIDANIPLDQLEVMIKPLTKAELQVEADAWFQLLRQKSRQIAAVRLGVKKTNEALGAENEQAAQATLDEAESVKETVDSVAETTEKQITQAAQDRLGVEEQDASANDAEESAENDAENDAATNNDDEADADSAADAKATESDEPSDASAIANGETVDADSGEQDATETAATMKDELLQDVAVLQDERTALSDRLEVVLASLEEKGGDVDEYRNYALAVSGVEIDATDAASAWAEVVGWINSKEGGQRWAWNLGKFLLILLVTYLVAKLIAAMVNWLLERNVKLSQLAERLIGSIIKNVIMLIGFAIALTALEIDITPILAAIGAAGLVVGLALQGTLSNFASGLMILVNRPFDVGHVVSAGGVMGKVHQMNLVSTTFRTFDNQTIHVPNNEIWNNVITNITVNDTRRVDLEFGIGYDDSFEEAEQIIREVVEAHDLVLSDPEPVVVTHALADSSVNIVCRPWALTDDWWQVKTDVTRAVKRRFDEEGVSIPYPQRDIHVYNAARVPVGVGDSD